MQKKITIDVENYLISTNKSKLDINLISDFLIHQSYWATTRTILQIQNSIKHSICFGVYHHSKQIAFARVISDQSTFAYLADVFVIKEYEKRGVASALMNFILDYPSLQNLRRFILATRDAHGLYSKFGFKPLHWTERWMEIYNPTKDDPNQ